MIYEKDIKDITIEDIEELIENETPENKFLEYKEYDENGEKDRILKTICGLANSEGGLFIYGIRENDGIPSEIIGVPLKKSFDEEKQRYYNIIYSNSEPKIYLDIDIKDLEKTDNKIILFKVPKSWNIPHRVKQGKFKEFYIRRDGRTDPLEIEELRNIFNLSGTLMEKIEEFRSKRIFNFYSQNSGSFKVLFHAIPLTAFSEQQHDLIKAQEHLINVSYINGIYKPNFEGIYSISAKTFTQLYRNGILERVYYAHENEKSIKLQAVTEDAELFIENTFLLYEQMNITSPVIFFITYTNIKDCNQLNTFQINFHEIFDKTRDILPSNRIYLESYDQEIVKQKVTEVLIPFWNHYGYEK